VSSLQYIAPAQIVPCPHLKVEEFELRPPDSDDWDAEPPTFPNALQVCTYDGQCRYQTFCCPQAWHSWDAQVLCAGYSVIYTGGDQTEIKLTVEPEIGQWWNTPPLHPSPEADRAEQLALIAGILLTPKLREEFPKNVRSWGYAGAVAYLGRALIGARTPQHIYHWPEAKVVRGAVLFWHVGRGSMQTPDETIPIADFIHQFLPEPPPEAEQLAMF
jgi:hypothetical protein